MCDYLSMWELQAQGANTEEAFKFLYKKKLFLLDPREDVKLATTTPVVFNLVFHQLLYDVRNSKLPVSLEDACYLAALQLQIKFGDFDKSNRPINKNNVNSVVPKHLRAVAFNPDEWIANLEKEHQSFSGWGQTECKVAFINRISTNILYGANIFNVAVKGKISLLKAWLCISVKGVSVWEPFTKDPKIKWQFEDISDGGQATNGFWLRVGNVLKPEKYTFTGTEASYIPDVYSALRAGYERQKNATGELA